MAEKQVPVEPKAPVEPRTRRGRRRMDDVAVEAARGKVRNQTRADAAKTKARTQTALIAEKEKQAELRRKKRQRQIKQLRTSALSAMRQMMVIGPIIAPMSVAWTGQSGFATGVLGWNFLASLLYAAAYELTTVFSAYMYHEAKRDGDKGWEYRVATWAFAAGAGLQQWWHYSDNWHATPRSVTYSTMTAVGVIVWELYARLIHRRGLRADGKLPAPRPRIGLARWLRYFPIAWTAWSGSVRHGFDNFQDMWTWAEVECERKRSTRDRVKILRAENKELKQRLADLETLTSDRVVQAKVERMPTPDPKPLEIRPEQPEGGPRQLEAAADPTPSDGSEMNPGDADHRSEETFRPTDAEIQALKEMADAEIRFNRQNVMDYLRDPANRVRLGQAEGIATKRAADVAKWGRDNYSEIKAVS
jgi:hypothetical protein